METYFRGVAGVHTYVAQLVPHLLRQAPATEFTLFATADCADKMSQKPFGDAPNVTYAILPERRAVNRLAYFAFGGRPVERIIGPHDVYHSPTILGFRTRGAYVLTIHDFAWIYYPHIYPLWKSWAMRYGLRWDLKLARLIISVSESAKNDLVELRGIDPGRIRVIHHGVSPKFCPGRNEDGIARTLDRLGIRRPYVLSPAGTHGPRKNLHRLVRAMSRVRARLGPIPLVVTGRPLYDTTAFERAIAEANLTDGVIRPGQLSETELLDVMSGARVVAFPSLYEGFGLPILEAMASGVPVVTSNVSSMPEVAGEAGILVDPSDEEAIAAGIAQTLEDDATHAAMRQKGLERASLFTWERTAGQVLEVYREAAG